MAKHVWRVALFGPLLVGLTGADRGRAQSKPEPTFEVASIRAAEPSRDGRVSVSMNSDRGRVSYKNVTLAQVLQAAYGVRRLRLEPRKAPLDFIVVEKGNRVPTEN